MTNAIPVTVLCGGLGAGKTTLLSHLLAESDRDLAVVVNDVGAVNVDADLVEARTDLGGAVGDETAGELVALENGCICCSLGGDLSRAVIRLQRARQFDALVVEASGVGEPEPIATQFVRGPAAAAYELAHVVTVVDARAFYDAFVGTAGESTIDPPEPSGPDETGTRPLADLWLEQVECCDLLVVNKCDLVTDRERDRVVALLETLQPEADVVTTEYSALDPTTVLADDGSFDLERVLGSAGWKRALEGNGGSDGDHDHDHDHDHAHGHREEHAHVRDHDHDHDHTHDTSADRYGLEVRTFHRSRPFHPERLTALLRDLPDGLVRAKGLLWIAGRERQALTMSFAGTQTTLEVTGRWIASLPANRQEPYRRSRPDLTWDERWGDREIRLALIGRDLAWEGFYARLEECLLTDAELDEEWSAYEDENPAPTAMGGIETISSAGARTDRPE